MVGARWPGHLIITLCWMMLMAIAAPTVGSECARRVAKSPRGPVPQASGPSSGSRHPWACGVTLCHRRPDYYRFHLFNDFFKSHQPPSTDHLFGTASVKVPVAGHGRGTGTGGCGANLRLFLGVSAGTGSWATTGSSTILASRSWRHSSRCRSSLSPGTLVVGMLTLVVVLVVGILFTPIVARTVRAAVQSERQLGPRYRGKASW